MRRLYRLRTRLAQPTPTRSVSEETVRRPRWRFGLVSLAAFAALACTALAADQPAATTARPVSAQLQQQAEAKAQLLARPTPEWLPKPAIDIPEAKAADSAGMKAYVEQVPGSDSKFKLVPIPGGKFLMGSPATEKGHRPDEGPQHEVSVEPLWMEEHEVTWTEYELWALDIDKQRRKFQQTETADRDKLIDAVAAPPGPSRTCRSAWARATRRRSA